MFFFLFYLFSQRVYTTTLTRLRGKWLKSKWCRVDDSTYFLASSSFEFEPEPTTTTAKRYQRHHSYPPLWCAVAPVRAMLFRAVSCRPPFIRLYASYVPGLRYSCYICRICSTHVYLSLCQWSRVLLNSRSRQIFSIVSVSLSLPVITDSNVDFRLPIRSFLVWVTRD